MNFNKFEQSYNLFNPDTATLGKYIDNSGNEQNSSVTIPTQRLNHSDYFHVSPNNTYTFASVKSSEVQQTIAFVWYTSGKTFISRTTEVLPVGTSDYSLTATAPNNAEYAIINYTTANNEVMLNTGSTAKPFEPYGNTWHDTPHYIMGTSTDTLTTLPAVLYPNAVTATVGLKGNMSQTGVPSPSSPIQPQETGERTENLFSCGIEQGDLASADGQPTVSDTRIRTDNYITLTQGSYTISIKETIKKVVFYVYNTSKQYIQGESVTSWQSLPFQFTLSADRLVKFAFANDDNTNISPSDISEVMLNTGSTAKPFEPYGYKIPILSASTTTPVYLGEVESTRKIKQLVLTGQETGWNRSSSGGRSIFYLDTITPDYLRSEDISLLCSHYKAIAGVTGAGDVGEGETSLFKSVGVNQRLYFGDSNYSVVDDFKTHLAQQYANGTPVTVWYVLATPTTGIVNEPIRKIGDYADTVSGITIPTIAGANAVDVLTTLKPSEVTVNYKGWHPVSSVHERDNGAWT